jgi:hypothetical protein
MIGMSLAWFVLGSRVLLWLQVIATKLILISGLLAFAGLATGQHMMRPGRDRSFDQKTIPGAGRTNLVVIMVTVIAVTLACGFITYLTDLSERTLIEIANILLFGGFGAFVMFMASFLYITVAEARLRRRYRE